METLNDGELDDLLAKWRAPSVPAALEQKVRRARRGPWWKWLLTGSIRVPVPATLAVVAVVLILSVISIGRRPAEEVGGQWKQAGFQPVKRIQPRIIRSIYYEDHH